MPQTPFLPYDPKSLPRELRRHYIGASETDIQSMLAALGLTVDDETAKEQHRARIIAAGRL